jgi:hypothetical protein
MPTLAATLKSEIRRITARELKKAMKPLRRVTRQIRGLRLLTRAQRRTLARVERRLARIGVRGGLGRRRRAVDAGPRVAPAAIRALRRRMSMTRLQFAKVVGVSAGSIFGWETGRSTPRGASRKRLVELKGKSGGSADARKGRRLSPARKRRPAARRR